MSGYLVVLACNILLYALVRVFADADALKKFDHHRLLDVIGFGCVCFVIFMVGILNGAALEEVEHAPGALRFNVVILGLAILTGIPWAVQYAKLVVDTVSSVADTIYGMDSQLIDKADLKMAHRLLKHGKRREAIEEIRNQCEQYPDAYSPLFLLAILAEEDRDFEKAVDLYRQIIQKHADNQLPWSNAASNLAELLRREYNDHAAAKHLEEEILKRDPDRQYKYSSTRTADNKKINKNGRNPLLEKADLNHARRMISRSEYKDAVPVMRRYIDENPDDSRACFELITLFERIDRGDDAITWLQKLIHEFSEDDQVWGNAMIRLAGLREHESNDVEAAISLLEQIAKRLKNTDHGRVAREQLKELRAKR